MIEMFRSYKILWIQALIFILAGILLIIVPELLSWLIAFILIWIGVLLFIAGFLFKNYFIDKSRNSYF